jgi:hypothetical protein
MSDELSPVQQRVQEALESFDQTDSFLTASKLLDLRDPTQIMSAFQAITKELFSQRKLARMIWLTRSGIEYALRSGDAKLIDSARKLAYNSSANLWPGWADEAVQPTESDLLAAYDLARVHRRLCQDAQLDHEALGNAHWLVGAQRLALGQEQAAHHDFEIAKAAYQDAAQPTSTAMAEGYVALSLSLMGTMAAEGDKRFEVAIAQLKQLGDDGEFFADQLQTAKRVFLGK